VKLLEGGAATVISPRAQGFTADHQQRATRANDQESDRRECRQA
jgi:hypothetical protein